MPIYYGANKIQDLYFAGNSIKEMYHGSILVYKNTIPSFFETTAGEYSYKLQGGVEYIIVTRGAGGAGGQDGQYVNTGSVGKGGAGGRGDIDSIFYTPEKQTELSITIGEIGYAGPNGNGGRNGTHGGRDDTGRDGAGPQYGGGGAKPSYVRAGEKKTTVTMYELRVTKYGWSVEGSGGTVAVETETTTPSVGDFAILTNHDKDYKAPSYRITEVGENYSYIKTAMTNETIRDYNFDLGSVLPDKVYVKKNLLSDLELNDEIFDIDGNKVGNITSLWDLESYFESVYDRSIKIRIGSVDYIPAVPTMTPTQIEITVPNILSYANGGGGGGGGGESGQVSRYTGGNGGGGGGGFYYLDTETLDVIDVPGQPGRAGASSGTTTARNGYNGNPMFSEIFAGNGGWGYRGGQGTGGTGGGASGAASGTGKQNDADYNSRRSGGGGGGAGGSPDAGGGTGGTGGSAGVVATAGFNPHTTPTNVSIINAQYGVVGDYGIGGGVGEDGSNGFVLIVPLRKDKIKQYINCGRINETIDETIDCGFITKDVDNIIDYGNYGATIESKDYGSYGATEESEDYGKIFIPADITETINNGVMYA